MTEPTKTSRYNFEHLFKEFAVSTMENEAKLRFLELLEDEVRGRDDICYFSEHMLGIPLNKYQKRWLTRTTTPRALWKEKFGEEIEDIGGFLFGSNISAIGNQSGKTVGIAIKHIWFNKYKKGMDLPPHLINKAQYITLNLSPHSRQTRACFQYVNDILNGNFIIDRDGKKDLNKLSPLMKDFLAGANINLGEIRFRNNSVMYSVPTGQDQAASLAGNQYGFISYDECSQSLHLAEELGAKILSRMIRYGVCLDLIATPEESSPSHQFYRHIVKLGELGREGWWSLTKMGMDDNEFLPKEQKERAKASLVATDKKRARQVIYGEFISSGKKFFDTNEIEHMFCLTSKCKCLPGHKYLISADWGMSDTGDESVFFVFDYTDYQISGKIRVVNHEAIRGGSPQMQFALLRTLYENYTWYDEDGTTAHKPIFVMDAEALGGVVIKKMLTSLQPKKFDIDKDVALLETRNAMSRGREYVESEVDGAIIESNPKYGDLQAYYIEDFNEQLGIYQIQDEKIDTDWVMAFVMGVSHIIKKIPKAIQRQAVLNPLAGYNSQFSNSNSARQNTFYRH